MHAPLGLHLRPCFLGLAERRNQLDASLVEHAVRARALQGAAVSAGNRECRPQIPFVRASPKVLRGRLAESRLGFDESPPNRYAAARGARDCDGRNAPGTVRCQLDAAASLQASEPTTKRPRGLQQILRARRGPANDRSSHRRSAVRTGPADSPYAACSAAVSLSQQAAQRVGTTVDDSVQTRSQSVRGAARVP